MKDTEKIIEKIKKVLELSKNNPSEEEAKAAALKAQRLMAEYHISMVDIDATENIQEISEMAVDVGTGNKWKYTLAGIVAKNFRCRHFLYGKERIVFYGYKVDTEIAAETFKFLYSTGNKSSVNYYNKLRNKAKREYRRFDGSGIKNAYLIGFLDGISEVLEKQCTALMIVVPKEVNEKYAERTSKGFRTVSRKPLSATSAYASQARNEGRIAGRSTIDSRKIAMA